MISGAIEQQLRAIEDRHAAIMVAVNTLRWSKKTQVTADRLMTLLESYQKQVRAVTRELVS